MMPPESQKRTQAASSAPEARGAVYQPVIGGWAVIRPAAWSWIEMPAISGRLTTRLRFTRLLKRGSLSNWTRHRCVPGSLQKARMQSEAHGIADMKGLVGAPRNIHVVWIGDRPPRSDAHVISRSLTALALIHLQCPGLVE